MIYKGFTKKQIHIKIDNLPDEKNIRSAGKQGQEPDDNNHQLHFLRQYILYLIISIYHLS